MRTVWSGWGVCAHYVHIRPTVNRPQRMDTSSIWRRRRRKWRTRNILDCDQSNYSSRIVFSHIPIAFGPTRNSAIHIIISYHIVHFSGASSETPAPQPLIKQVSFQQCCKCSWGHGTVSGHECRLASCSRYVGRQRQIWSVT